MICLRSPCIIRAGHDSVRMSLNSDWQSFSYPLSFVHPQWRKYQTRCNLHVYNAENIPLHSDNGSDSRQRWYLAYGKIGCILWAVFFRMKQYRHIICFSKRINRLQDIVWQINDSCPQNSLIPTIIFQIEPYPAVLIAPCNWKTGWFPNDMNIAGIWE